jgi:hypothetical protein
MTTINNTKKLTLAEFHKIVADYECTDDDSTVDLTKFHSVKIADKFKEQKKKEGAAPPQVQYIDITLTDRTTGNVYPAKFKISPKDNIRSKGIKPLEEREKQLPNADPSVIFTKNENPILFEALDNFYFQINAIYEYYKSSGKFVDRATYKKKPTDYVNSMVVPKVHLSNSPVSTNEIDGKEVAYYRYTFSRTKDDSTKFTNPVRDTRNVINGADGKLVTYGVATHNNVTINTNNIHEIINSGTIHFGEMDFSQMSASSMGLSAKGKFYKDQHYIVYTPKKESHGAAELFDQSELDMVKNLSVNNEPVLEENEPEVEDAGPLDVSLGM